MLVDEYDYHGDEKYIIMNQACDVLEKEDQVVEILNEPAGESMKPKIFG